MVVAVSLAWLLGCGGSDEAGPEPVPAAADPSQQARVFGNPHCTATTRGRLVSVRWLGGYTTSGLEAYFDSWLNGLAALGYVEDTVDPNIQNGADTYKVEYCTVDYDGAPIKASGLMAIPRTFSCGGTATVMYAHGTSVTRIDTPSNTNVDDTFDGPSPMAVFAGGDYIFLAPDLTGFGSSDTPRHRYFHAQTEADSELDMLDAVEDYWLYWLKSDGRLFNMGFSQGGHTALAFAEAAESAGYDIEATAVVGAVPDPDAWFDYLAAEIENPYLQLYAADLLVSYDDVYDLWDDPADAFASPYDETVDGLFDMNHWFFEVVEGLPGSTAELLTEDFYAEVLDPGSEFRTLLRDNAVDDVCLDGPIQMYHSIGDAEVPYDLAEAGRDALACCNDVELIEWRDLDHLNTWHEVLPVARDWFDTF